MFALTKHRERFEYCRRMTSKVKSHVYKSVRCEYISIQYMSKNILVEESTVLKMMFG